MELLTESSQCIHAVYRGAKRKHGIDVDLLVPYQMSWRGDTGLVNVISCESHSEFKITGSKLYSALYINELTRLGIRQDQLVNGLFEAYSNALRDLSLAVKGLEDILRVFEKAFLKVIGFELQFHRESPRGDSVQPKANYTFIPGQGFKKCQRDKEDAYSGVNLLAIAEDNYEQEETRRTAKAVLSEAIRFHLGKDTLKSRGLYSARQYRNLPNEESSIG